MAMKKVPFSLETWKWQKEEINCRSQENMILTEPKKMYHFFRVFAIQIGLVIGTKSFNNSSLYSGQLIILVLIKEVSINYKF